MEFIKSTAPVTVAEGAAVYLILTIKKKRESGDIADTYMSEGTILGLCLGAGVGASMSGYLSYFISLGILIGPLVGMRVKKQISLVLKMDRRGIYYERRG